MKITVNELKQMVGQAISEAKSKKPPKAKIKENEVRVDAHIADSKLDFSPPLGGLNPYRQQGQANFGPFTGDVSSVVQGALGVSVEGPLYGHNLYGLKEDAMRLAVRAIIAEALRPEKGSAWAPLAPTPPKIPGNVWESAMHWYDFQARGLGRVQEVAKPKADQDKKGKDKKKSPAGRK